MAFEIAVQVIGINPDVDQMTGERYTHITIAKESIVDPSSIPLSQFSLPNFPNNVSGWKYILNVFIPTEKWNNQYKMWQKYTLIVKDNGELELKQQPEENV